ncbi:hypothetical protein CHLNCDRAFT_133624 [Chlorella variabilis]|uniref:Uncharacterized protein n=1 Tax=Chlorella variabilis TaxID=554065 RepID=E1Z3G8_CHLVA|nr:hypothetical protein CHLNCDRAFT_133624 [Chlorella variabilis]EFN59848.1 hypothetical protein CHLNCDRAFT_133624 [Chlorella variabilis]|eukprot:XP_005851950.1 hypothetical protein CHLNCDRAFT_133624 [Chlorella variabilis]
MGKLVTVLLFALLATGVHGRRELPKPTCTTNAICLGCLKDKCSQCAGGYSLDSKGVCVQVRGAESVVVVVDACR